MRSAAARRSWPDWPTVMPPTNQRGSCAPDDCAARENNPPAVRAGLAHQLAWARPKKTEHE